MMKRNLIIIFSIFIFSLIAVFFLRSVGSTSATVSEIILATTTSTYDSGLLDVLIPVFEKETGYIVKIVSVGTGKALLMGEEGNADVLLVHAPAAEEEFMGKGYGIERTLVMHNDFVLVGPQDDPAGIQQVESLGEVLWVISQVQAPFVSRGDDSGTHKKERELWLESGVQPAGDWYFESGQGMGATLQIASEKGAYTLTDRATYLSLRDVLNLEILAERDLQLLNIYHVMIVNPERWPGINLEGARSLVEFLVSSEGQTIIKDFGVDLYDQPLFVPDAGKSEEDIGS